MTVSLLYLINVCIAFLIIIGEKLFPSHQLLLRATIENGPYEVATALILFIGGIILAFRFTKLKAATWLTKFATLAMASLCVIGAGEEISWGQHWIGFETNDFFQTHNQQQESNLHNLIDAVVFSTIINVVIYGAFTLYPLFHWLKPHNPLSRLLQSLGLQQFIPSITIAILLLLANCFHAWLIPATYSDSLVLIGCWLFACYSLLKKPLKANNTMLWFSLGLCLVGFIICTWAAPVFAHANMQYEIRECFTAFLLVYWAFCWSGIWKNSHPEP